MRYEITTGIEFDKAGNCMLEEDVNLRIEEALALLSCVAGDCTCRKELEAWLNPATRETIIEETCTFIIDDIGNKLPYKAIVKLAEDVRNAFEQSCVLVVRIQSDAEYV